MILEGVRPKSQKDSDNALGQDTLRASADFTSLFIFLFKNNFIYLFICFGCAGSLLLLGLFFSSCSKRGLLSGFLARHSCCGSWALGTWASVIVAHRFSNSCGSWAVEPRLSSCGAQT